MDTSQEKKKVLYFGIYNPSFIRNKVIHLGFRRLGYEVVECRVDPNILGRFEKYRKLYRLGREHAKQRYEYVIVGFPGATVVWLARLLFGKRIIFDAFLSQYDTNVLDRKLYGAWSLQGMKDWLLDWYSCMLSSLVLLPEEVHIDFFVKTFHIPKQKFIRVFTGANDEVFHPIAGAVKNESFTVHFHGSFIPLQGVRYIMEAADILKDEKVHFQLIGSGGKLYEQMQDEKKKRGLSNVAFEGRKPLEEIPSYISRAHVCLGVFGESDKAKRVISNKVYECLASGGVIVTARTPAMEELLTDREHVLFCKSSDGADLAEKIRVLKQDEVLRQTLAQNAYQLFTERLAPERLVEQLVADIQQR